MSDSIMDCTQCEQRKPLCPRSKSKEQHIAWCKLWTGPFLCVASSSWLATVKRFLSHSVPLKIGTENSDLYAYDKNGSLWAMCHIQKRNIMHQGWMSSLMHIECRSSTNLATLFSAWGPPPNGSNGINHVLAQALNSLTTFVGPNTSLLYWL